MNDFDTTAHALDLSEHDLRRKYLVFAASAWIAGAFFLLNIAVTAFELANGRSIALLAHVGVGAFIGALWFTRAFRAYGLRHRTFDAAAVLRTPSEWFPSPFVRFASIDGTGHGVQLLHPINPTPSTKLTTSRWRK